MIVSNQQELLSAIKSSTPEQGPAIVITIGNPVEGILRPVSTVKGHLNSNDIRLLTKWRNQFAKSFLTEFNATESGTERWLTDIVGPDDRRILFMVDDVTGRPFGSMGLALINWENRFAEADAIVRGAYAPPGTMKNALNIMLKWAKNQLNLSKFRVRVRSDNTALDFYRKFGFQEIKRVRLRRVDEPNVIRWVEDISIMSDVPSLVYMIYECL